VHFLNQELCVVCQGCMVLCQMLFSNKDASKYFLKCLSKIGWQEIPVMHHSFTIQLVSKVVECLFPTRMRNGLLESVGHFDMTKKLVTPVTLPVNDVITMWYRYLLSSQYKISVGIRFIHAMLHQPAKQEKVLIRLDDWARAVCCLYQLQRTERFSTVISG
jgi:hypothetical protein